MKYRYSTISVRIMALVVLFLLTGCATLRPPMVRMSQELNAYNYVYIPVTQGLQSSTGIPVAGMVLPYSQSVNPRDVIAGLFAKKGFIVLPHIEDRFRSKTLMVSYGESGRRNLLLGLGYTIEVTLQLISAQTGELVGTATAEGCGMTESDDIKQAINRALSPLLN